MKAKKLLTYLSVLLLSACSFPSPLTSSSVSKITPFVSVVDNEDKGLSSSTEIIETSSRPKDPSKPNEVTVFSINDVHGSLEQNEELGEPGVARLSYSLHHDPDYNENSLILSAGDSWQGGYLAHEEKTLTDSVLGDLGVKAMALGNHEFDWGPDVIKTLSQSSPYPYLGCNIFNADQKRPSFLKGSTVIQEGNIKYGVIGAIGPTEESSVSSFYLQGYSFSDDLNLITKEINSLKKEDCDLIVLAVHDGASSAYVQNIGKTYQKEDIAGIFGGHTHTFNSQTVGNLPYVQGGHNTLGYAKMTFDLTTHAVLRKSFVNVSSFSSLPDNVLDQNIITKIQNASLTHNGDLPLATFQGDFRRYHELNKFIPDAMIQVAEDYGWGNKHQGRELLALHNLSGIRSDIPSGTVTDKKLFKVSPFDNQVKVIENIKGSSLTAMIQNVQDLHSTYREKSDGSKMSLYAYSTENGGMFSSSKTYDVVTIDFVSSGSYWPYRLKDKTQNALNKKEGKEVYIRDVLIQYLMRDEDGIFKASDYYPY